MQIIEFYHNILHILVSIYLQVIETYYIKYHNLPMKYLLLWFLIHCRYLSLQTWILPWRAVQPTSYVNDIKSTFYRQYWLFKSDDINWSRNKDTQQFLTSSEICSWSLLTSSISLRRQFQVPWSLGFTRVISMSQKSWPGVNLILWSVTQTDSGVACWMAHYIRIKVDWLHHM